MSAACNKNLLSYASTTITACDEYLIKAKLMVSLLFTGKTVLLMKNSVFLSKMVADRGISLQCFLEVEAIWKYKMARIWMKIDINWNQK